MGRELRKVTPNYKHPRKENGKYEPLLDGYEESLKGFMAHVGEKGLQSALDYFGSAPSMDDYMLAGVPESEKTHYMMFEDTGEGTPISPAFATKQELLDWLVSNNASYFGSDPACRETWERVIKGGFGGILVNIRENPLTN